MSRAEFDARFPDEEACAGHLWELRWPDGFSCPDCGCGDGDAIARGRMAMQCARCRKQTSVTAGTFIHRSHLPLKTWFAAFHIVTSHSNGISALQLQAQLGLGSCKTAWLLLQKIRRSMVMEDRTLLEDLVEVDETDIPFRTRDEPREGGQGRSLIGKMHVAGAVELSPDGSRPRRIRLAPIADFSSRSLHPFVAEVAAPGSRVVTDGWPGYSGLDCGEHTRKVVGNRPAHLVMAWIHRVFSHLKRWALGTFHGLRRKHLQRHLDEFVFRWNRRRHTAAAFGSLIGNGLRQGHACYRDFVDQIA